MTFRLTLMAAATLAAAIVGCSESADDRAAAGGDTSSAATAGSDTAAGASAGGAVAGADDGIVFDSIPVRTPDGGAARFGRRSGHLRYRYSGDVVGFRESWFIDWGMTERRVDSSAPAPGKPGVPQHNLVISTPQGFNVIDMIAKTGMRMPNNTDDEYLTSDSGKVRSLGEMIFRTSGGRRLPDTTINGLPVAVLQLDQGGASTRIYVWQGIILREEMVLQQGLRFTAEVESMEFDIDVPASTFKVPAGITMSDAPAPTPPGGPQGAPPQGAAPPGAAPPGAMPPGAMPPGNMPPGGMPPGGGAPMPGRR